MHMAMMNHQLLPEVETLFIMSSSKYMFISSSIVKEAALLGGSVGELVPPNVEARLQEKWGERQKEKGLLD